MSTDSKVLNSIVLTPLEMHVFGQLEDMVIRNSSFLSSFFLETLKLHGHKLQKD